MQGLYQLVRCFGISHFVFYGEVVPLWRLSLFGGCLSLEVVPLWRLSLFGGCLSLEVVPLWRLSLFGGCPSLEVVPLWRLKSVISNIGQ